MIEFDLGEGNQLYFDPENPSEAAKEANQIPKYIRDGPISEETTTVGTMTRSTSSQGVQKISHGPRINMVLPEKRLSGTRLDLSPELLAEELDRVVKEKTKLEGQLEVRNMEDFLYELT